jgi:carbamoyl-phosphate synthase large subunit
MKNILVTAVGGRSVGSGILHALTRNSKDVNSRWNAFASDADSFSWGLYKVPPKNKLLLPYANAENYLEKIKEAIVKFNIDAIIPGSEAETNILSKNKDLFNIPIIANENSLMPLMMDKFATAKKIIELNLPSIPTLNIENWEEAVKLFGFPLIVKPTIGTGGSKGVNLISSINELTTLIKNIPPNSRYCIQPLLGSEDEEYTVGILSDKNGKLLDSIVMKRKLIGLSLLDSKIVGDRKYSISTGYSQGFFIKHEQIQDFCERLSQKLGSKGPLNIQLRIHKGEIYVFEIHPRFSGTTTMRADVGFNEPDILLRNYLFNEDFNRIEHKTNVAVIRAFEHTVVPINEML